MLSGRSETSIVVFVWVLNEGKGRLYWRNGMTQPNDANGRWDFATLIWNPRRTIEAFLGIAGGIG